MNFNLNILNISCQLWIVSEEGTCQESLQCVPYLPSKTPTLENWQGRVDTTGLVSRLFFLLEAQAGAKENRRPPEDSRVNTIGVTGLPT